MQVAVVLRVQIIFIKIKYLLHVIILELAKAHVLTLLTQYSNKTVDLILAILLDKIIVKEMTCITLEAVMNLDVQVEYV